MNRFLRKKTPETVATLDTVAPVTSLQSQPTSPGVKKSSTSRWRKKKPVLDDQTPKLDLATALPTNDDFRTSLLMPNLSARFSMLREQDDPSSLLGKASDDSVLLPKRKSRMADFGYGRANLGDIAEVDVASIRSSIRPPFAAESRQHSFASDDGYASEGGSTYNSSGRTRSRPGEGNILFGGRQRIYMIPSAASNSSRSLGRAVYEDDISLSPFQKYRKQREATDERPSDDGQGFDFGLGSTSTGDQVDQDDGSNDTSAGLSHSPSLSSYDKKRSTSSTSRSEARSSFTAATSVGSHPGTATTSPAPAAVQPPAQAAPTATPLKRQDTKTRRLYEQGLDQHMYEQQTSALTRLNSIQRQRTLNNRPVAQGLHGTKSAGNLHDKASQPVYAVRTHSPVPPAPLASFGSIRKPNSSSASPNLSNSHSPTNGEFEDSDVLNLALEPGDRGKATAMGAFNKPQQAFDEEQYLERQRQLQRSNSAAALKREQIGQSALQQRLGRFEQERQRTNSDASAAARSRSRSKGPAETANGVPKSGSQTTIKASQRSAIPQDKSSYPDTHRTFFGDISASESEDDEGEDAQFDRPDYGYGTTHGRWQPTILPPVSEHPALRQTKSKASLAEEDEDAGSKQLPAYPSLPQSTDADHTKSNGVGADSATVSEPVQLNGLMHHLRQSSNQSSVFRPDSVVVDDTVPEVPEWNPKNADVVNRHIQLTIDSDSRLRSSFAGSNPWDLEDATNASNGDKGIPSRSVSPMVPQSRDQSASRAASRTTDQQSRESEVSQLSECEAESEMDLAWQNELRKQHTRDASTETQQERNAFADELAARRQAIQQNIKSMVDEQKRAASPNRPAANSFKAMLRAKSSRETVVENGRQPTPASSKSMKTLGMSAAQANASSTSFSSQYERRNVSFESGRPRGDSGSRPPLPTQTRALYSAEQDVRGPPDPTQSREGSERMAARQQGRSPASSQASTGGRSRANSEVAGNRSRSRTGPYRDDLERAMIEGTGFSTAPVPVEPSPNKDRSGSGLDSPDVMLPTTESAESARNNRNGTTGYFDNRSLQPIQTNSNDLSPGPGHSPSTWSPLTHTTTAGSSVRPSPAASPHPFASNPTLPLSSASTPVSSSAFTPPPSAVSQNPSQASNPRARMLRKKTISKHDISEPTLISLTSNIDTVDLPEGASLKNGMDEAAPPIPPINPKRRGIKLFKGRARQDSFEGTSASSSAVGIAHSSGGGGGGGGESNSFAASGRAKSPEEIYNAVAAAAAAARRTPELDPEYNFPQDLAASVNGSSVINGSLRDRSASNSPRPSTTLPQPSPVPSPGLGGSFGSPSLQGYEFSTPPATIAHSPERLVLDRHGSSGVGVAAAASVEGGMF